MGKVDELDPSEQALGFIQVLMLNFRHAYYGTESMERAVVYPIGPSNLIIKVIDADGRIEYSHRCYGNRIGGRKPDWLPVAVPIPDPKLAISTAKCGADMAEVPESLAINPMGPTIPLQCPACSHEFDCEDGFIPLGEMVECRLCKAKGPAEQYGRPNI